jgi:hypothetical protein
LNSSRKSSQFADFAKNSALSDLGIDGQILQFFG